MVILDELLLNHLSDKAAENQRLRINYNLHEDLEEPVQRLLNALEPGTVLPIHRHPDTAETYVVLRGALKVLLYNDAKELTGTQELNPSKGVYGVNLPANQWHTIEVLEKGTVIFEIKQGPYRPFSGENIMTL